MIIIYAANIHTGGGKVLLEALLKSVSSETLLFADERMQIDDNASKFVKVIRVKPTYVSRLRAEFELKRQARQASKVLSFGNLPPILSLSAKTDLYFQNTILLRKNSHFPFPLPTRIKHQVERMWLTWGLKHIDKVYVQSQAVRDEFLHEFPTTTVRVAPFVDKLPESNQPAAREHDFIYVASGDPHKNHLRLLRAWGLLAEAGLFPSLALTVSNQSTVILNVVSRLNQKGLKIINYADQSHSQVLNLYSRSGALIFPSLTESFGLPLLEARELGLPILASELDFVRELVSPIESFDPQSEKSIFRAVVRSLGKMEMLPFQKISSPREFLELLESK